MEKNNDIIIINLDKPRQLRYGHKALKKIKALTGKSVFEIDIASLDPEEIEKVVYAGLISEDKDIRIEQMEDILDQGNYTEIIEGVAKAIATAFGVDEKNLKAEVQQNGTGMNQEKLPSASV